MTVNFAKMHGLGNDFMVIDNVTQEVALEREQIARWADRRTGIGFDQLLEIAPPTDPDADFFYRIYNADGSQAEQCGNGARCIARYARYRGLTPKTELVFQTTAQPIRTVLLDDAVRVDMGVPSILPADVPYVPEDGEELSITIEADDGMLAVTPVSVGNPHGVIFVDDVATAPVEEIGAALTRHPRFPEGANIGFCQVVDRGFVRLRVFERGVGETRACGTGACAAAIAGVLQEKLDPRVKVSLLGGKLRVHWPGPGEAVSMTGPTSLVYEGATA